MIKKLISSATKRLAAADPRGPKRSPAQSKGSSNWNLYGPMIPEFTTSRCAVNAINTDNNKVASSNLPFGGSKWLCPASDLENQVRINGGNSRIAIALPPHQTLNDCANEWLMPVMLNVAAPRVAPSIGLNTAAKPSNPINSLSVARVGRSATNRLTSQAPVTAWTVFAQ